MSGQAVVHPTWLDARFWSWVAEEEARKLQAQAKKKRDKGKKKGATA